MSDEEELRYDVVLLGDPIAGRDDKLAAVDELTRAGLAAVPLLVSRLADPNDAVFLDEVTVETGPMNPGPPVTVRTTARFMSELVLYRIIAPEPAGSHVALGARASKTGLDATRPAGGLELDVERPPVAWVRDWGAWWAKHRGEGLDAIRRDSAGDIDRIWTDAALASGAAPSTSTGPVPHLPAATTGGAEALASSTSGLLLQAWRDPALAPARAAYAKMSALVRDAERDPKKRAAAKKQLEDAARKEPRLRVHVEHWLAQLRT